MTRLFDRRKQKTLIIRGGSLGGAVAAFPPFAVTGVPVSDKSINIPSATCDRLFEFIGADTCCLNCCLKNC